MPRSVDEETLRQVYRKRGDSIRLGVLFSSAFGLPLSFREFVYTMENFCFNIPIGDPCQSPDREGYTGLLWLGLSFTMVIYGIISIRRGDRRYGTGLLIGTFLYVAQLMVAVAMGIAWS